ncbi:nucleotide exchange factor GrpE [Paenibacillus sp. CAA11]|uniref:nucleotide exchange factor GrpE n=1 Tax=Paenibacillus sp. CAA11 TaxID=1532905 RepID=UPI000D3967D1|nr:nucleotide exchange factor GrpE [Paenibacillus sp. CAA11]
MNNEPMDQERSEEPQASAENTAQDAGLNDTVNEQEENLSAQENSEITRLRAEAEEHQQRLLRVQADFDNFRRRTLKEKEELGKYASAKLITELLPVFDNFERALAANVQEQSEQASFVKGVEMIFRQLDGVLQAEGLKAMESVGQPFNPEFHQAIMQVESDEYEEGIVVEEVQKGYLLKDKVLRPAMVKVSG